MAFLTAAWAFIRGNWRWLAPTIAAGILAVLLYIRTDQRDDARASDALHIAQHQAYRASVRAISAQMRASFAESSRRQQAQQAQISQEVSSEYQARLAQLRADYERRMRDRPGPGNGNQSHLPAPGSATARSDGTPATALPDVFACEANTLQLEYLQRWNREQAAVDPVSTGPGR